MISELVKNVQKIQDRYGLDFEYTFMLTREGMYLTVFDIKGIMEEEETADDVPYGLFLEVSRLVNVWEKSLDSDKVTFSELRWTMRKGSDLSTSLPYLEKRWKLAEKRGLDNFVSWGSMGLKKEEEVSLGKEYKKGRGYFITVSHKLGEEPELSLRSFSLEDANFKDTHYAKHIGLVEYLNKLLEGLGVNQELPIYIKT